jgi:dinuclear metal center YbgI/SA1388 family protein
MPDCPLSDLVAYAGEILRPGNYIDYDRAWNGLQVENGGRVTHLAAAVDATLTTVEKATALGADCLIVHHGLFWAETRPWTGRRLELIRRLIQGNLAVYSQHLPLDGHPELGNAAQLCRALGFEVAGPFFARKDEFLGVRVHLPVPMPRKELFARLTHLLGKPPIELPGGNVLCQKIGICTGGAGSELAQAHSEGVDTFITGEGPHWSYALAEDLGINAYFAGHYATETFGVKALAAALGERFNLPWTFIDHPTGL